MSFGIPVRNGIGIGLKASTSLSTRGGASGPPSGQQAYTTPGTYSWVAPAGVTSVSVVCVGGGSYKAAGGLGWKNAITVIPGNSYSLRVGNRSQAVNNAAQSSYFINEATVKGGGTLWGSGTGGTFTGDGGGNGGSINGESYSGGGAGGYTGNGGAPRGLSNGNGSAGAGGGGGGGATRNNSNVTFYGGGGGGVGILGQGANGSGGIVSGSTAAGGGGGSSGGTGGTAGSAASPGNGGLYGGGGGSSYNGISDETIYQFGVAGAVRIIWGAGRAFPATNTGDL